jgi:nucleoside-diphosphate-sugar epimerase|tara:strand:+ start:497 stop:1411 length:915 start_codon:yes stop_codon:yes gene_type:complete
MSRNILIVGGTGFIGFYLAKKCIGLGWNVVSVSLNPPKPSRRLKKVKYLNYNISNKKTIKYLSLKQFDYVVNLGGYIEHLNLKKVVSGHYHVVKNLYNYFRNKNLKSFIQIGSSAEYGRAKVPHKENFLCKPAGIYGKYKLKSTNFLLDKFKKNRFPVTVIRFYQVYGPKQNIDRFIPILINACIKNIKFPSSHGKQKRDFLYVDDAISAILKSLNNPKCIGKIINVGSGKPIALLKIMKYVQKKIGGGELLLGKIKLRKDEPMIIFPYLKNAKKILNWKSKISFNSGINRTIKEYKKQISKFS